MISTNFGYRAIGTTPWTYLPKPGRGYGRDNVIVGGMHQSTGGQITQDVVTYLWTWTLPFVWLTNTEFNIVNGLFVQADSGPWQFTENNGGTAYTVLPIGSLSTTSTIYGYRDCTLTLQQVS